MIVAANKDDTMTPKWGETMASTGDAVNSDRVLDCEV